MNPAPRILFLSHGGGPLPLLGDPAHAEMAGCLEQIATNLPRPSAILLISAHWEEPTATVTSAAAPELIYDYYGFPPESYQIRYPCPGNPALAQDVYAALAAADISVRADPQRGFDHGLFVPLKLMYPDAGIPCVQLSLLDSLDPGLHIRMGQALQALEQENLLVIGSGFSFHNMQAFFAPDDKQSQAHNSAFEQWLKETCASRELSEAQREQRLQQWMQTPSARYCHPREEHLLPLHVCYGLAQRACSEVYELSIMNKRASMYLWQAT